jgi:hypothetical protein
MIKGKDIKRTQTNIFLGCYDRALEEAASPFRHIERPPFEGPDDSVIQVRVGIAKVSKVSES